ncbi:membrane-bound lytic murein transglycosylase D [Catalinimonas alkaloidigena]|uniref:lytic transglycosylase domain-containing protein n=1 Tax=Catalinimonas alkaloidigena TaxID=1075417 RepID=UPI00240569EA|nr:lytic transglycosylase domain-containing protein [Catalinimonas alkaloidigena]MDF9795148.1 membrane-bound lytic murein transglycosylase D [Catalinimonas alkaloidigena]
MSKNMGILFVTLFSVSILTVSEKANASTNDPVDSVGTDLYEPAYDYEYIPDASYELVEDRIACLETDMPLVFNERVKAFVDYFTIKNREYTRMVVRRQEVFFPLFEKYLKKYGIPEDLKYLSIVESGLNPEARSRVGAVGLWQFMPSTGRMYGLGQDWYVDERMNPEKSTEAACKYLKQLYNMFDDWELALAAYNTGPGNVRKAIRRSGYKRDFWSIYNYLPRETRSYVPQFVAVLYTLNYLDEHNLREEIPEYTIASDTLWVSQFISLKALAEQINVCEEDLTRLNPELKRGAVPETAKNYPLLIPSDTYDFIAANTSAILDSAGKKELQEQMDYVVRNTPGNTHNKEKIYYRVRSGDVLGVIAERHGVRLSDLRTWNNISGSRIYAGQKLAIWVHPSSNQIASSGTTKAIPDSKVHLVQPGDSLWEISRRYQGLSVNKIKQLNNLTSNKITPGQKLIIGR